MSVYVWRPRTYSCKYFSCSSLLFVVCACLHHRGPTTTTIIFMNELAKLGIPLTGANGEFLESLLCQQVEALFTLRLKLLSDEMGKDLCDSSDELRVRLNKGGATSPSRKRPKISGPFSGLFVESQAFKEASWGMATTVYNTVLSPTTQVQQL